MRVLGHSARLVLHKDNSLGDADAVIVADVYAAGEAPIDGASRDALVEGLRATVFSPDDLELVKGGPALRRGFLDDLLSASAERGSGATVADTIAGNDDPVASFESQEMREMLADAIAHLPERERLILTLYYYEGLTLAEIGRTIGVTESRVCQIHTKSIIQLRSRLTDAVG